jgi:hypothetical protein
MRTTRWITLIVSAFSLVASACARNAPLAGDDSEEGRASATSPLDVVVTNNSAADVKVYAMAESGSPQRLGTVTGLSSTTFKMRRSTIPEGMLRLAAVPIGGYGVAQSGILQVTNAHEASFVVQPNISTSFGLVR